MTAIISFFLTRPREYWPWQSQTFYHWSEMRTLTSTFQTKTTLSSPVTVVMATMALGAWFFSTECSINLASEEGCWFGGLWWRWRIAPLRLMERNLIRGQEVIKKLAEKWKGLPGEVDGGLWALVLLSNIFVFSCASRNVLASSIC